MTDLPELPDVEQIMNAAIERRDYFNGVIEQAQLEVDKANKILAALGLEEDQSNGSSKGVSEDAYIAGLKALAGGGYAGVSTLTGKTGYSASTINAVMRTAVARGHAVREKRGRRMWYQITAAGQDAARAE